MLHGARALHRIFLMAPNKPKSQCLHQGKSVAGTALQNSSKTARTMSTESSFGKYAEYLNNLNEKRERVVKASRDVTMNSKKVIFQVHRIGKYNREEVLEKAEKDLAAVTDQYMSRLVKELQGTDFWKLRRAYSPGVQEYVEAATFCKFCRTGTLLNLDEINATLLPLSDPSLEPLQINILDYLLGLADLTGELMRLAIGRISDGEPEFAERICRFVRKIYRELSLIVPHMDDVSDMKTKMDTMLQSMLKIENDSSHIDNIANNFGQTGRGEVDNFLALVCMLEDRSTFHCLDPVIQVPFFWGCQTLNYEGNCPCLEKFSREDLDCFNT